MNIISADVVCDCPTCGARLVIDEVEARQRIVCARCRGELLLEGKPDKDSEQRTSRKAIFSLVLGLASVCGMLLTAIPAVLLGMLALRDIRRSGQLTGRGLAISGIVSGTGFGLFVSACVGLSVVYGWMMANAIRNKNNPQQIAAVAATMDVYTPPPGTKPVEGVDMSLAGMRWVVHADSPPTRMLMAMQFSGPMEGNTQQMEQQMQIQTPGPIRQHLGDWINFSQAPALTVQRDGKALTIKQYVGTGQRTGVRYRKYEASVDAPQGPILLMLVTVDPAAQQPAGAAPAGGAGGMTEAQVKQYFQSLQVGKKKQNGNANQNAGSGNSNSKGGR